MRSKRLSEKGRNILYFFKLLPGFHHLSNFIQIQSKTVDRCISGNGNMDMPVIHVGNGKFISINRLESWDNCLQKYSAEAYDEYLDEYVEKAQNDTMAIYDSKKQDFEDVADIFIRGIDSIIDVLKLVEALIEKYKDTRISADIDNT